MGYIGKRHAEVISANEHAELVAVCDVRNEEELEIGNLDVPFFSSASALMSAGLPIDVVCICTPNGLHAQHAMLALHAGKHVLIEKPVTLSVKDGNALLEKAREKNLSIFCVMQNRYSPPSVWLKETVESGWLGKIFSVQINCYWNRDERYYKKGGWKGTADLDGGTLFTQFSHFIDILNWIFGDIKNITARFSDFTHQHSTDFEDSGIINFDLQGGGTGSFNYSTAVWDKNLESSITVIAENGSIKIGGQYMNKVDCCHIKDYTMPQLAASNPANEYGPYSGSAANHGAVYDELIRTINGGSNKTNAAEAVKVTEIIERIYRLKEK